MDNIKDGFHTPPDYIIDSENGVDIRLGESTKIPMPDRSYAQEILDRPIPLENRIAHLVPYVELMYEPISAFALAKRLDVDIAWVRRVAAHIGMTPISGSDVESYPPLSFDLLQEELLWELAYNSLDEKVSLIAAAEFIAKDTDWVMHNAYELGFYFDIGKTPSGRTGIVFPKQLLPRLRHLILAFPPAEDWYLLTELSEIANRHRDWVAESLEKAGFETEERWSALSGKLHDHYPPESRLAIEALIKALPERATKGWRTTPAIADWIDMSDDWVKSRIREMDNPTMKILLDSTNKRAKHYSHGVAVELRKIAVELKKYPEIGDWLTVAGLVRVLSKSHAWVVNRLPYISAQPEQRRDNLQRILLCYPPDAIDELRALEGIPLSQIVNEHENE